MQPQLIVDDVKAANLSKFFAAFIRLEISQSGEDRTETIVNESRGILEGQVEIATRRNFDVALEEILSWLCVTVAGGACQHQVYQLISGCRKDVVVDGQIDESRSQTGALVGVAESVSLGQSDQIGSSNGGGGVVEVTIAEACLSRQHCRIESVPADDSGGAQSVELQLAALLLNYLVGDASSYAPGGYNHLNRVITEYLRGRGRELRQLRRLETKLLNPSHKLNALTEIELARTLISQQRYREALDLLRPDLRFLEDTFGPQGQYVDLCLLSLAQAHRGLGEREEARSLYRRALEVRRSRMAPGSEGILEVEQELGDLQREMGPAEGPGLKPPG